MNDLEKEKIKKEQETEFDIWSKKKEAELTNPTTLPPASPARSDSSTEEDNKIESVKMKTHRGGKFYCARSIFNIACGALGLIILLCMIFVLILVDPKSSNVDKYLYIVFFAAGSFATRMKEKIANSDRKK